MFALENSLAENEIHGIAIWSYRVSFPDHWRADAVTVAERLRAEVDPHNVLPLMSPRRRGSVSVATDNAQQQDT